METNSTTTPVPRESIDVKMEAMTTSDAQHSTVSVAVPAPAGSAVEATDETMKSEDHEEEEEGEEGEVSSDEEEDDKEEEDAAPPTATPEVSLVDANGRPLSDFEVAARYAEIEIQSMSSQFATAVVDPTKPTAGPALPGAATSATAMEDDEDSDDDEPLGDAAVAMASSSSDESSDDDDEGNANEDPRKLRAEIEAAMEREENKVSGPLKTPNEVAAVPVREPEVELTSDCPIARCGIILNVSRPGLMVTVKSDGANSKPLDEGSVLCFEDRTVLGCVDEVFGPVMMPMYLVRFETAEKIPTQTDLNKVVFFATQHTTYLIPENLRDKGTDASNIFDEETDETVYSDDEAEAAAKRLNKKRNRGGDQAPGAASSQATAGNSSGPSRNFSDYQAGGGGRRGGRAAGGGGRGRGRGREPSHGGGYQQQQQQQQHQPHGGFTRYTTPGGYPPQGMPAYPPPGQAPYLPHQGGGGPPQFGGPPQSYNHHPNQYSHMQGPPPPPMPMYPQPPYGAPQHLPSYPPPPQAPPPNYHYNQPPVHGYPQPPLPPGPPQNQYGGVPPPPQGYYQQQDPKCYSHQGQHYNHQQQPPPPPPPSGPYGPPRGRHP